MAVLACPVSEEKAVVMRGTQHHQHISHQSSVLQPVVLDTENFFSLSRLQSMSVCREAVIPAGENRVRWNGF